MSTQVTIRKLVSALTALIFVFCGVTCLGIQPVTTSAHDCCPRTGSGDSCPQQIGATACSLHSIDLPKSKQAVPRLAAPPSFDFALPSFVAGEQPPFGLTSAKHIFPRTQVLRI